MGNNYIRMKAREIITRNNGDIKDLVNTLNQMIQIYSIINSVNDYLQLTLDLNSFKNALQIELDEYKKEIIRELLPNIKFHRKELESTTLKELIKYRKELGL